jgi:putative endonuclease
MMENTREKGAESEDLAAQYLIEHGYTILNRNWYSGHNEIDIVARKNGIIAVVEVRSLSRVSFQEPYQSVNKTKQRAIIAVTNAYIRRFNINDEIRFDIISILHGKKGPEIEHIEGAFYPMVRK